MKSEVKIVSPYKSATNFYHLFGLVPYEFMRPQMGPNGGEFLFEKGPMAPAPQAPIASQTLKNVDHIRNVFPETWLWTNSSTGYDQTLFEHMHVLDFSISIYFRNACKLKQMRCGSNFTKYWSKMTWSAK